MISPLCEGARREERINQSANERKRGPQGKRNKKIQETLGKREQTLERSEKFKRDQRELEYKVFDLKVNESIGVSVEKAGYSLDERLTALGAISNIRYLVDCAVYDVVGVDKENGEIVVCWRKDDDQIRVRAVEQLSRLCTNVKDVVRDESLWGGGLGIYTGWDLSKPYSCGESPNETTFPWSVKHLANEVATYQDANACAFYTLCEVYAKVGKICEFLAATLDWWGMQMDGCLAKDDYLGEKVNKLLTGVSSDELRALLEDRYKNNWLMGVYMTTSKFCEKAYDLLTDENKLEVARVAVRYSCMEERRSGVDDLQYDWALESRMIMDNRESLAKEFGVGNDGKRPPFSAIKRLGFLLKDNLDDREKFEGIFARKFGESVSVEEKDRMKAFRMDFYRVRFDPEKKSKSFDDYYVWATVHSHKVFAIEARSKKNSTLEESRALFTALAKKYKLEFSYVGGLCYEMIFPQERCQLKVFKSEVPAAVRTASRSLGSDDGAALFTWAVLGPDMGNYVLAEDLKRKFEAEQKLQRIKDMARRSRGAPGGHLLSPNDRLTGDVVLAEDVTLFNLARKESILAEEEAKKERALKAKRDADSAADAF